MILFKRKYVFWSIALLTMLFLFALDLATGSVSLSLSETFIAIFGEEQSLAKTIVTQLRFPRAVVAILAGCALSVAGLLLQTMLQNPLAGPSVLGITAGGSLGVAAVVLGAGASISNNIFQVFGSNQSWLMVVASIVGSFAVLLIILYLAMRMYTSATLLIVGLMIANIIMAIIGVWQYFSRPEEVYDFMVWSFGNLGGVTNNQLGILGIGVLVGLVPAFLSTKGLDLLQLDEWHARASGVKIKRLRLLILLSIGLLAGTVTAFCGPIGFIGIAIPHVTRVTTGFHRHIFLIPATAILGAITLLLCDWVSHLPGNALSLPLNVMTAFIGSPVVIWVLLTKSKRL